jgi:hypothetical protein
MPCPYKIMSRYNRKKVIKSVWRMPWLSEAMKDVVSCDKLRGGANYLRSGDFRMGQPTRLKIGYPGNGMQTRGTETSKYPEEEKTIVIPQVVASERGTAQTGFVTARPGL